jgi:hypothetical protein
MSEGEEHILFCVSDHGFGHAARTCYVIKDMLFTQKKNVVLISDVPEWFIRERCFSDEQNENLLRPNQFIHLKYKMDVGVFQHTSVSIDVGQTIRELENFWAQKETKLQELAKMTEPYKISVVYSDVNAISAFLVAKKHELPQFNSSTKIYAASNFTWDWIYSKIDVKEEEKQKLQKFIEIHQQANLIYDKFIILPFHNEEYFERRGNFFQNTIRINGLFPIPQSELRKNQIRSHLIELYCTRMKEEGRREVSDPNQMKLVLYSFGGFPFPITEYMKGWRIPEDWVIIWIQSERGGKSPGAEDAIPFYSNVLTINELDDHLVFNYVDILASVDVVVIKTGFGVVSEVMTSTPL